MHCEESEALLGPFLDGELGSDEAGVVRRHLAGCPGCRRRLEGLTALEAAVRDLRPERPSGAEADLETVLARARKTGPSPAGARRELPETTSHRRELRRSLAIAATVALVVAGGVWIAVERRPAPADPEPPGVDAGYEVSDPAPVECLRPEDCGPGSRPLWPPMQI